MQQWDIDEVTQNFASFAVLSDFNEGIFKGGTADRNKV